MPSTAKLFVQTALARAYPRAAWMFRNRTWLIQETVLPVLSVSAFALSYKAMGAPPEYVGFVILGAAMTTFWLNVLWAMGAHLYWERDSGNLGLYIMAPAPMMGVLAGMALGGMTTTCVRAAAIVTAGLLLFDVPLRPTSWWLFAAIFLLTLVALYGLGMMFASLFLLWGREAWHTVNLLQEPVYLLTGMNFPLRNVFPMAVAGMALLIPLAAGMDAMRQVLFRADGVIEVRWEVGLLVVLSVVFLTLAKRCLDYLERRAREDAKLTVRWE
ncbi:MAG TPA: ABC transporter permease [Gemmataceae bacterium]|jgi:ABC-2 type transport system permease protein|nr:ABC transporter permease [Gemmataceae bacterium]